MLCTSVEMSDCTNTWTAAVSYVDSREVDLSLCCQWLCSADNEVTRFICQHGDRINLHHQQGFTESTETLRCRGTTLP